MLRRSLVELLLSATRKQGAVVVSFHQIVPDTFQRLISELSRHFCLASLDELVENHARGRTLSRMLALTFDDGWRTTCDPVAAICEAEGWPITIYVMASLLNGRKTFWFAELPRLLKAAAGKRITYGSHTLDLRNRSVRHPSVKQLIASLSTLPADEAIEAVCGLRTACGLPHPPESGVTFIDRPFLEKYRSSEWVSFGSHTVDHQSLSSQDEERIHWQLSRSKSSLEEVLEKPVMHLAYPYGSAAMIGDRAHRIAGQYYSSATTLQYGIVTASSDPWYLPRIPYYDDVDNQLRFMLKLGFTAWT